MTSTPTTPAELLSHYEWVRGRARRLAGDAATADDLAGYGFGSDEVEADEPETTV